MIVEQLEKALKEKACIYLKTPAGYSKIDLNSCPAKLVHTRFIDDEHYALEVPLTDASGKTHTYELGLDELFESPEEPQDEEGEYWWQKGQYA